MSDYLHVNTQARKAHRYDFGGCTKETTIEHLLARRRFVLF